MTEIISTPKRGRKLAAMIAGALALGVLPLAMPASAQTGTDELPDRRDIGEFACPVDDMGTPNDTSDDTTEVPEAGFTDVAEGATHEASIDCIVWYEVARGTSATTYNPGGNVKRDQMASFIAQLIDYAADPDNAGADGPGQALPAVPTGNQFPCDLTNTNTHYNNIQRLAAAGVVAGTGSSSAGACYDPGGNVTRNQMATFIKQAQDHIFGPDNDLPLVTTDYFADDENDTHENNINIIASESIARGTGTDTNNDNLYSPGAEVRRDQMASFLANKLDVLVDPDSPISNPDSITEPPPAVDTVVVSPMNPTRGNDITVTVTSIRGNIDTIAVSGCGITGDDLDEVVSGTPLDMEAVATVEIPAAQTAGACTLTVVTTFEDNDSEVTNTVSLTVNA